MSHRHHGSDLIIAAVLGVLANAFPRTAGFIVLVLSGTAFIFFAWIMFLVVTEQL